MLELQCTESIVYSFQNTNAGLVQLSKWRECKPTDAEKLLSQWEKVAKCNFKSNALARPRMLKSFFLSERKFLNAILRVKLKYMKDVFFSWNEMSFAMQKTDFHVLELFCKQVILELQCTESEFRTSKNTNAVFCATKQLRELKAMDGESFFLSERKFLNAILRVKLKYMKDVSFSWNEMLFAMQKTVFMC